MSAQNPPVPQSPNEKAPSAVLVVYPSWAMKNALASLVNLVTLLVGIAIGVMLAPRIERPARAITGEPQVPTQNQPAPGAPTPPTGLAATANPEQIQPTFTAGSEGVFLLLSHHIQSDELVVNGIDVLKLEQGELNLLSHVPGVMPWELSKIVTDARDTHLYQVGPPPGAQNQPKPPAK